jgi:hypothetical protein
MVRKLISSLVIACALLGAALLSSTRTAHAADQVVNNCSNDAELRSDLYLMEGIGGGGTLTFNCGTAVITLTSGVLPTINVNTTINGGNAITLRGSGDRIFYIDRGANSVLNLQNIILESGYNGSEGGAIYNLGSLSLNGVTVRNSYAPVGGGAIWTDRPVNITNSTLHDNFRAKAVRSLPRVPAPLSPSITAYFMTTA